MFSTAFATMKFLSLTSPIIGLSSLLGIAAFLATFLSNLEAKQTRAINNMLHTVTALFHLRSGILMVPVFFFLKSVVWGFTAPFGFPKVAPPATCKWLPPIGNESPARLPTPGLDVVFNPKVVPVGADFGS
jgi:hypothetical protein